MPEATLPEFAGKTITNHGASSTVSWHASEVARNYFGINYSMAWGVNNIHVYDASSFVGSGFLKVSGSTTLPSSPPDGAKIFNSSWIGSFGTNASDNEALRRADYLMHSNSNAPLFISGENNGAGSAMSPLMSMSYNGLAVGVATGAHSAGVTPAGLDGPGRQKPEIVAPAGWTSFSTPIVSSAAALLYQTGSQPPLDTDPYARRSVVIKSVLMSGAKHRATWANDAPQSGDNRGIATKPLDPLYGADTVNINRSHLILTGGRTFAATTIPELEPTNNAGWMQHIFLGQTQGSAIYARFNLKTTENTASIILNWSRYVGQSQLPGSTAAPSMANLDLTLYRLVDNTLIPLSGPGGNRYFDSGNCASKSTIDNVEHVFLRNLDAGEYVLEVKRMDSLALQVTLACSWIIDSGPLLGDINLDGFVNGGDLGLLLGGWGQAGPSDLDEDGNTTGSDIGLLLGAWTG